FQPEYSGPTQDGEPYVARRWWRRTNGDVIVSVAEFDFKKPRSPKSWLRYWKTSHACVAQPVKDVKSLPDLGTQLTIAGVCKGGDSFAMHILHIDSTIVELNVASMDYRRSQSELIQLLGSFLSRVHSKPASEK
ncbi:MAG TPA: hypothetical protein PKD17_08955, partial [Cellvibrionaceae bacterium]|nr:hypothetical protein [Cellvibrionaceae bacterium]